MRFFAHDQVVIPDGRLVTVVQPFSGSHGELFDLGAGVSMPVYWVLMPNGEVRQFAEDALISSRF